LVKARDTIRRHTRRLGVGLTGRYGWLALRIAELMKRSYEGACAYCMRPYRGMGHGLHDITLDVIDPRAAPYFATNVTFCCRTCNLEKGTMTPVQWAERLAYWREYATHTGQRLAPLQLALL
jgi:hypothetical protein